MSEPLRDTPRPPVILTCPANRRPSASTLAILQNEVERILASDEVYSIAIGDLISPEGPHYLFTIKPYFWEVSPGRWERRDGHQNPSKTDIWPSVQQKQLENLSRDVYLLCLGYTQLEDLRESCANRIKTLMSVFFLDADTRMEPSGKYVQSVPDRIPMEGDYAFTISLRYLVLVCWTLPLLRACDALIPTLDAVSEWFEDFTRFLLESRQAGWLSKLKDQTASTYMMHGTPQVSTYANSALKGLLGKFPAGGEMFKRELLRARPAHYTLFTLEPLFLLASLSAYHPTAEWSIPASWVRQWLSELVEHARYIVPSELESIREGGRRYYVKLRWLERLLAGWAGNADGNAQAERPELDGSLWKEGWSDLSKIMWEFM